MRPSMQGMYVDDMSNHANACVWKQLQWLWATACISSSLNMYYSPHISQLLLCTDRPCAAVQMSPSFQSRQYILCIVENNIRQTSKLPVQVGCLCACVRACIMVCINEAWPAN